MANFAGKHNKHWNCRNSIGRCSLRKRSPAFLYKDRFNKIQLQLLFCMETGKLSKLSSKSSSGALTSWRRKLCLKLCGYNVCQTYQACPPSLWLSYWKENESAGLRNYVTQNLEICGFKRYCTDDLTTKVVRTFASNIANTASVDLYQVYRSSCWILFSLKNGKVWFKNSHVVVLACLKKGLEGCSQYSASGRNIRGHFKTPLFLWSSLSLCI